MNINTKYEIGEEVYYLSGGKVKKGKIDEIYITVKKETGALKSKIVTLYSYRIINDPRQVICDRYSPSYVFKSKELAAKFAMDLLSQLDNLD